MGHTAECSVQVLSKVDQYLIKHPVFVCVVCYTSLTVLPEVWDFVQDSLFLTTVLIFVALLRIILYGVFGFFLWGVNAG